jgi:hypothetical protein
MAVYRVCLLYLKHRADAEDATQNVFVSLLRDGTAFASPEHEKAWCLRTAVNGCKNVLRGRWRKHAPLDETLAVVRVLETWDVPNPATRCQAARLTMLRSTDAIPQEVDVVQWLAGGCVGDRTNLVRTGGVYVLALAPPGETDFYYGDGYYYALGDIDVLFEVDDQGLIHSHSSMDDFRPYDGQPLATLWADISDFFLRG